MRKLLILLAFNIVLFSFFPIANAEQEIKDVLDSVSDTAAKTTDDFTDTAAKATRDTIETVEKAGDDISDEAHRAWKEVEDFFGTPPDGDRNKYLKIDGVNLDKDFSDDTDFLEESNNTGDGKGKIQAGLARIIEQIIKVMGLFAFGWMIYAGLQMIVSQGNEEQIENGRRQIQWSIIALMLVFLIEPLVTNVFYGSGDEAGEIIFGTGAEIDNTHVENVAKRGVAEIMGFIKYLQMFVAIIALGMLILSAFRTFFAQDKEDAFESQKKSIVRIGVGIITITFSEIMIYFGIYNPETGDVGGDKARIFSELSGLTSYFLGFVAAVAVASIIYGGFLMVTANGDDEKSSKGRSIVVNILIGSVIIFVSYSLVSLIVNSI